MSLLMFATTSSITTSEKTKFNRIKRQTEGIPDENEPANQLDNNRKEVVVDIQELSLLLSAVTAELEDGCALLVTYDTARLPLLEEYLWKVNVKVI